MVAGGLPDKGARGKGVGVDAAVGLRSDRNPPARVGDNKQAAKVSA